MKVTEQIVLSKSNVALGVEGSLSLIKDLKLSLEYGLSRMQQDQRSSEINYAFALSKWVCAFGKSTAPYFQNRSAKKDDNEAVGCEIIVTFAAKIERKRLYP